MKQKRESPLIQLPFENAYFHPYDIGVIEGYSSPDNFPNCCPFHGQAFKLVEEWFNKFPNCCDRHKKFMKQFGFQKKQFENVPQKVMRQLSFTEYHISKRIDIPNWYEDITAYIEWNVRSFGQPEVGFEWYWRILKHFIQHFRPDDYNSLQNEERNGLESHCIQAFDLPDDKRQKLLEYFETESAPPRELKKDKDLDLLFNTFQDWVETFPDLDFFRELKEKHSGKIPMNLFLFNPVPNPYTGMTKFDTRSQTELIEILFALTKQILDEIDTIALIEAGAISNANEYKYQLARESHRLKQSHLVGNFTEGEKNYRHLLETWLANEKVYFDEIEPLFNKVPQLSNTTKVLPQSTESNKPTQPQIALLYRYLVQAALEQPITVANRNEVAKKYGFTAPTSGQKIYDWFNKLNTLNQRTAQGKYTVKNLVTVIILLSSYPAAKIIAEEELKTARRNNQ